MTREWIRAALRSLGVAEKDLDVFVGPDEMRAKRAAAPQSVGAAGQPYELFRKMRALGAGASFGWRANTLVPKFEKQARMMANFEDDWPEFAPCGTLNEYESTLYNGMRDLQLRTYFTWRARFRKGEAAQTDTGYLLTYLWETARGIGVEHDGELPALWSDLMIAYGETFGLTETIRQLMVDYYVTRGVQTPFLAFCDAAGLPRDTLSPKTDVWAHGLSPGTYELALRNERYDPRQSAYYADEKRPMFEKCYDAAAAALAALYEREGIKGEIVLWGRAHKDGAYRPFVQQRVEDCKFPWDGAFVISPNERYVVKAGVCARYQTNDYTPFIEVYLGCVLKRVEARMRLNDKFKYKLRPSAETFEREMRNAGLAYKAFYELIRSGKIDEAVDRAVDEAMRPEPERVKVDKRALARIRKEADITREKLLVEEPLTPIEAAALEDAPPKAAAPEPAPTGGGDEWDALAGDLSQGQKAGLVLLLGGADVCEAAKAAGEMPEVFIESVNALALERVGDNIAESGEIFEEYRQPLSRALGRTNT